MDAELEVTKVDRRRKEFRDADRAEAIRPSHTPANPRYDKDAELARADALVRELRDNNDNLVDDIGAVFNIPPEWVPPGFVYEGKRCSVGGKSEGRLGDDNIREAYQKGWRPVPASRHPALCPVGFTGDTIVKSGLMLMERPLVLVKEARAIENAEAARALADKKAQLTTSRMGLMDRADANVRAVARHSYSPVEVPN